MLFQEDIHIHFRFLLHLSCCHDLFTLQKFCACIDNTFLVPNEPVYFLERHQEIMVWSSILQEEKFIYISISRFVSLVIYQLQLLWTYWTFTSYFLILKNFCMSLFGCLWFWVFNIFANSKAWKYAECECCHGSFSRFFLNIFRTAFSKNVASATFLILCDCSF